MPCRIPAEFLGWTRPQLQAELSRLQQAIADYDSGNKIQSASYQSGDGAKNIVRTPMERSAAQLRLEKIAGLLFPGQGYGRRRPLRPVYLR